MNQPYKFPDEQSDNDTKVELDLEIEPGTEIEIVDDTPAQDQGRKPLDREITDPTDEELNEYSSKVQKRMKELTHKSHDERRKAETLFREKQALEQAAKVLAEDNKRLQEYVQMGQTAYIDKSKSLASIAMNTAKAKFTAAFDAGDSAAAAEAQQEMMEAQREVEQANNFKPTPLRETPQPVYTQPTPDIDEKVSRWLGQNRWFRQEGSEDMTGYAEGVHKKLVREYGLDYTRSDEYYQKIDSAMRKAFPENFDDIEVDTETPQKQNRQRSVVAPASRSTAPKKIRLSLKQQEYAKRYSIPLERMAQEVAKMEAENG
jgi:hypothetical protein